MNVFMFVAVMCIGQRCDFLIGDNLTTEQKCIEMKQQFLNLPFKPEVTLAATQCVKTKPKEYL